MMALRSMMTCVSLTLWRQEGKEDRGITFVQVRFYGYGSMYKQWGGSVFCLFGLEYRYSSVVLVPEFNTGIRPGIDTREGVSVPKFLNGTRVSVLAFEYRYWLPENENFALLWNYADELQAKNPGSTVGNRLIMGLDGCFLKGPFKGVLLTTVGRIDNDQMYLIAWVVAEGETTDSWSWFLSLVSTDLGMEDGFDYTIISDQHKGLKVAINDIFPRVEHRNCARHVYVNWYERKKEKNISI
ncbi:hypothetical protein GQ457_04G024020 [Hibiscus cannabinus]